MSRSIAFFDFDGTLTTKDSLLEFIKFSHGKFRFLLGFALNIPYLVAYKLKIISNQKAKEKILSFFFKDMPVVRYNSLCEKFSKTIVPDLLRTKGIEEIKKLKEQGTSVVIVSASPENWIKYWADLNELKLIATKLVVNKEFLTGKIEGINCHGEEKVRRIKEQYNLEDYSLIMAYGDTSGDKPMLSLAHQAFMKPFRK